MEDLFKKIEEIEKAFRDGERGKYRRIAGKTVFIRSKDKKVTKGPAELRGKRLIMKQISTADMVSDLGSPSAEVILTDHGPKRKKRVQVLSMVKSLCDQTDALIATLSNLSKRNQGAEEN